MEVRAVEETKDTIYLVLPFASAVGEGGELSDEALDAVAGGGTWGGDTGVSSTCYSCQGPCGG
jgi:hypothetical protein